MLAVSYTNFSCGFCQTDVEVPEYNFLSCARFFSVACCNSKYARWLEDCKYHHSKDFYIYEIQQLLEVSNLQPFCIFVIAGFAADNIIKKHFALQKFQSCRAARK